MRRSSVGSDPDLTQLYRCGAQTAIFLFAEIWLKLADTLQAEDFGCPAKHSLRAGQPALLRPAISIVQSAA